MPHWYQTRLRGECCDTAVTNRYTDRVQRHRRGYRLLHSLKTRSAVSQTRHSLTKRAYYNALTAWIGFIDARASTSSFSLNRSLIARDLQLHDAVKSGLLAEGHTMDLDRRNNTFTDAEP